MKKRDDKKQYTAPRITVKTTREILEVMGPAVAIYGVGPNEGFPG